MGLEAVSIETVEEGARDFIGGDHPLTAALMGEDRGRPLEMGSEFMARLVFRD